MKQHLLFYDGSCGLCDQIVQFVLKQDTQKQFCFAPLQGPTAARLLTKLPAEYKGLDSLVLIENYESKNPQYYVMGKGAFRIFWLLGGAWKLIGWISFLPAFLYDWGYRLVAKNRHYFFPQTECILPAKDSQDRFLP